MPAADYRILTDATGQRIAAALEGMSVDRAAKTDLTSIIAIGTTNTTGAAIAAGTYFYLNGALVQANTNIARGATFTSGTNYEVVTAGGLNSVKKLLSAKTYIIPANNFITITDLPMSYVLTVNPGSNDTCVIYAGVGYGATSGRHIISKLVGPDNPAITVTALNDSYGAIVTNTNSNAKSVYVKDITAVYV